MRMRILTTKGIKEANLDRGDRSVVGGHWSAIGIYVRTGRVGRLREFEDLRVGKGLVLETDPDSVDRWWFAGELEFLEVYAP